MTPAFHPDSLIGRASESLAAASLRCLHEFYHVHLRRHALEAAREVVLGAAYLALCLIVLLLLPFSVPVIAAIRRRNCRRQAALHGDWPMHPGD